MLTDQTPNIFLTQSVSILSYDHSSLSVVGADLEVLYG